MSKEQNTAKAKILMSRAEVQKLREKSALQVVKTAKENSSFKKTIVYVCSWSRFKALADMINMKGTAVSGTSFSKACLNCNKPAALKELNASGNFMAPVTDILISDNA